MSTSADDHTGKRVKGEQIAEGSIHHSESHLDDDCVSENSYGSSFGENAMDEEDTTAGIELDSLPPVYSNEEYRDPQLNDIYPSVDLAVVPQYPPLTRSVQPAFDAMFSGPPMCVVGGLIFNPALTFIN